MNTTITRAYLSGILRFEKGPWQRPRRSLEIALFLLLLMWPQGLQSQESPPPSESSTSDTALDKKSSPGEFTKPFFQRLFVPEEQVGKLVPRDYMPITVSDLEMLLSAADLGGAASWDTIPSLDNATYFAKMRDDILISEFSIWTINYINDVGGYLLSSPTNLALGDAIDTTLMDSLGPSEKATWRVDSQQRLWLPVNSSGRFIFGWRLPISEALNGSRAIEFQTPAANRNRLFLQLDSRWLIRCEQGVVKRIDPTSTTTTAEEGDQLSKTVVEWIAANATEGKTLWQIDFSGSNRLQLQLASAETLPTESVQQIVASTIHQYRLHQSGIDLTTRLGILNSAQSSQLRLEITPPLKIRDIRLDGNPLKWSKVVGALTTIEIDSFNIPATTRIGQLQINAFAPWEHGITKPLPGINIPNGKILRGETSLESVKPILPLKIKASGGEAIQVENGQFVNQDLKRWQWRWSGNPLSIELETISLQPAVQAASLTRLSLGNGSLTATSLIRLSPSLKSPGKATLELGEGWILDSVSPLPSSTLKYDELGDKDRTQILLRWEEYISDELLTVEIQSHRAIETVGAEIRLPEASYLTLAEGYHKGTLALETTGRYMLKATPDLLNARAEESELAAWQRDRLPRFSNIWLLKAENGQHPELVFTSEPSTYTSNSEVRVSPHPGGLQEEYKLRFRPLFGSMDRVNVRLKHAHKNPLLWRWQDGEQQYALQATRDATDNPDDGESYVIFLPQPITEPFELRSSSLIESNDWHPIAWATSDQATNEENHVLLADSLEIQTPQSGWIAMVSQSMNDTYFKSYRAESNLAENIYCRPRSKQAPFAAWARNAEHKHWHFASGIVVHQSKWNLENSHNTQLELHLPKDNEILEVQFDSNIIQGVKPSAEPEIYLIDLPGTSNRGELTVIYRDNASPLSWQTIAAYRTASLNLPCLVEQEFLFLPRLYTPFQIAELIGPSGASAISDACRFLWQLAVNLPYGESLSSVPSISDIPAAKLPHSISLPDESTWKKVQLTQSKSEDQTSMAIRIWDIRVLTVWILGGCCILFLLSVWLWRRYPRSVAGLALACALLSIAIPPPSSVLIAIPILPLALGLIVALSLYSLNASQNNTGHSASVRASLIAVRNALPLLFLLLAPVTFSAMMLCRGKILYAEDPKTYGILIPYSAAGELKGNYVYVPMEAYNVLNSFGGRSISPNSSHMFRNASYQLRITDDMNSMSGTEYDLFAEYDIEITDSSVPITWPISSNDAKLERLIVNQFEIIPGFTVRQDESAIRWLPERNGLAKVRLQLAPKITSANQSEQFELAIPIIPSATLSVTGSAGRKFNVQGATVDNPSNNSTLLHLGSIERIRFSMQLKETKDEETRFDSEIDSWLHFQGKEAVLLTQLRVRTGDLSTPQELTIQMDDRWQPCGRQWGDARWIGLAQPSSTRGLRDYRVKVESFSMAESKIYIAWVPRGEWLSEDISPPLFPDSPSLNTTLYTYTTSGSSDATWSTEVSEAWSLEAADRALVRWEGNGLAVPNRSYSNPSKTPLPTIIRVANRSRAAITETCTSSIQRRLISLRYEASWNEGFQTGDILQFALPPQSIVEGVTLNAIPINDYAVVNTAVDSRLLLTLQDPNSRGINNLVIQATKPLSLSFPQAIPRITSLQPELVHSLFALYREANLAVTLENVEELPESRLPLDRSPQQMLREHKIGILSLDLTNRYQNSTVLPLQFRSVSPASGLNGIVLGKLFPADSKWRYSLTASLTSTAEPIDSLVFELPASIPPDINIYPPTPFRLDPSPDGTHQLLSVYPETAITGNTQLEIQFDILKGSGQVAIPQASLLGTDRVVQWVALPQVGNGGNLTWRTTGLKPATPSPEVRALLQVKPEKPAGSQENAWQFFEPINRRFQADLQSGKSNAQAIKVLFADHQLTMQENGYLMGHFTYLLHPEGFLTADFEIPEGASLLGALVGDVPQLTLLKGKRLVEIPVQPSDLPVIVELFLQYTPARDNSFGLVKLPKPINLSIAKSSLTFQGLTTRGLQLEETLFELDGITSPLATRQQLDDARWKAVESLLMANRDQINSLPPNNLEAWSSPWNAFLSRLMKQGSTTPKNEELAKLLNLSALSPATASSDANPPGSNKSLQQTDSLFGAPGLFLKEGSLEEVKISGTKEPIQIPFSWIVALAGFLFFITSLARNKNWLRNIAHWLSSQPATVLFIVAVLLLAITRNPNLSLGIAVLATISLILQLIYRVAGGRNSRTSLGLLQGKSSR